MIQRKSGIVWIAAYPRSGNTWTRLFVCNLARLLAGAEEERNFNNLLPLSPWDGDPKYYREHVDVAAPDSEEKITRIAMLRHQVHRDFASRNSGLVFGKTHWLLGRAFDRATFDFSVMAGAVYCVRNPLDVAISLAHHLNQTVDFAVRFMGRSNAYISTDLLGSWSENVESWTRSLGPDVCIVRFEDLLEDPHLWFGVVARHIFGAQPTEQQIARAVELCSFDRLQSQEEEHGYFAYESKAKKFFRAGRRGQWRKVLNAPQVERILHDHGAYMGKFGYLPLT